MKNLIMGILIFGCLAGAAVIFLNNNGEPTPVAPNVPPPPSTQTPVKPKRPHERLTDDFVPNLPKRVYPGPIVIAEGDLPAKVTSLILALNVLDNADRRTTGGDLAALPAAAVPLMR